jgi:hypothetical protein
MKRSPGIKVEKIPWPFDDFPEPPMLRFRCQPGLRSAKFQHRKDLNKTAILHPSTKVKGLWQLSKFDAQGPWGDTEGTCDGLVKELNPRSWRLRKVTSR